MIHIFDFFPTFDKTESGCLLFKVGVLAARHLVYIYFRVWKQFGLVSGFIIWTYGFPITG